MAATLRLSPAAEEALERIMRSQHLPSKNAATERAILEMDARGSQVERALAHVAMVDERDADLLNLLSR